MKNKLVSYAIMTVNNRYNRDYYSLFIPFVAETIRLKEFKYITPQIIKKEIQEKYDLEIPTAVINQIFNKLDKEKLIERKYYADQKKYLYHPNYELIDTSKYNMSQTTEFEDKYDDLILEYCSYIQLEHKITKDSAEAENDIYSFIEQNEIEFLNEIDKRDPDYQFYVSPKEEIKSFYLVASFINHSKKNNNKIYSFLLDIVKGNMLKDVLFFDGIDALQENFKKTRIYFDTSFMLYALGFSGKERQVPCLELIDMLRKNEAQLYCFNHNVDEMTNILTWTKHNLYKGRDGHDTIKFFIDSGYAPEDIDIMIHSIPQKLLEELNINIDSEEYTDSRISTELYEYFTDEAGLADVLRDSLNYRKDSFEQALNNDVKTVSMILRMRSGYKTLNIEDSKALFVTTNKTFAKTVRDFMKSTEVNYIPPVLYDSMLTNLVWLKDPGLAPDFPQKRLIANCYAAITPTERFWKKYLDESEKLFNKEKIITKEDLIILRYASLAEKIIMDETKGDAELIDSETVEGVLLKIEELKKKELDEQAKKHKDEILNLKMENERKDKLINNIKKEESERKENKAEKIANLIITIEILVLATIIGVISFYALDKVNVSNNVHWIGSVAKF
ncbi:hypothetical protein CUS80_14115, partial [Enterococcus faecium]|uniref:hypothetical protein n=1 Tax=Enterococcus faecium TaxID=1352 RepID=UPI000D41803E